MQQGMISLDSDFAVQLGNHRSQAAEMVLQPGETVGGPDNRHQGSDQWLFVVSGMGEATVDGKSLKLSPHSLLLIERGESHRVACSGSEPLRTLNFYVPPAYDSRGEPLPSGESG